MHRWRRSAGNAHWRGQFLPQTKQAVHNKILNLQDYLPWHDPSISARVLVANGRSSMQPCAPQPVAQVPTREELSLYMPLVHQGVGRVLRKLPPNVLRAHSGGG